MKKENIKNAYEMLLRLETYQDKLKGLELLKPEGLKIKGETHEERVWFEDESDFDIIERAASTAKEMIESKILLLKKEIEKL